MQTEKLMLAYIGTPQSYFTRKFLPALQQMNNANITFICLMQDEPTVIPENSNLLLKWMLLLKQIKLTLQQISSRIYWSVYCAQHRIHFERTNEINTPRMKDLLEQFDFVITAGVRTKLNADILSAPKNGVVNFHYSLLPKFRGTNPVFWQRLQSDENFGYTFHLMNENIDRGKIVLQKPVVIDSNQSVSAICDLITDHASTQIIQMILNPPQAVAQNENNASEYSEKDYLNYIHIDTNDDGANWNAKCTFTGLFILNERWIVHMDAIGRTNSANKLSWKGLFVKNGFLFQFKKINYLPPVFYYFALRKYFE